MYRLVQKLQQLLQNAMVCIKIMYLKFLNISMNDAKLLYL